jgi:hypothetical protein
MATEDYIRSVRDQLNQYDPITLEEMDGVKLMDRTDVKFNFNIHHLPELLHSVRDHYRVLEVSGTRMSRYETLYYDTPEYDLYKVHHNGKPGRFKIRVRKYVESDLNFFEVKHKNNKGRTIKSRVKKKIAGNEISGNASALLSEKTGMQSSGLEPKLWVNYTRITLVNRFEAERLTIDLDLQVINDESSFSFDGLVIVEAKMSKLQNTPFVKLLKDRHIRQGGVSKYCMAVSKLVPGVKSNNFKPKLLNVDKILNENNVA